MAAAFIFAYHRESEMWLAQLRSARVSNPLRWGLPGGGVDEGEKPDDGARREFFEEVGYRPNKIIRISTIGDRHLFLWPVRRQFEARRSAPMAAESESHDWFPLHTLPEPNTRWLPAMWEACVRYIEKRGQ